MGWPVLCARDRLFRTRIRRSNPPIWSIPVRRWEGGVGRTGFSDRNYPFDSPMRRLPWAVLLARVFQVDVLECPMPVMDGVVFVGHL